MVWFSISTTPAANALSWVRGQQAAGVVDDTAVVSFELVHAHYHTNKQTNMRLVVSKYQYYICILDLFCEIKKF